MRLKKYTYGGPGGTPRQQGYNNSAATAAGMGAGTGAGGAGGGFDYMSAISGGVGAITSGVQTGMLYSNMVGQAKERERREQEALRLQGDRRYMGLTGQMRGNTYGMFNRYQTGGVANPYGTMTDPDMLERTGQRKITEQATEDITIATLKTVAPPVGKAIEQGISLFTGIQDAAGRQDAELDGKAIDVYPDETAAAVGNAADMFMPHNAAFKQAQNKDYGRAVLSWTGIGAIPNMIEAMQDQEEYETAQERLRTSSGRMVGGKSGLGGTEIVGGTNMTALREQQEIPMVKYGGLMEKYGSGGYRVEKRGYMDTYKGGGLYANIHAKRERIKAGSGESMRSPGSKGAPTDKAFTDSAKTAKMGMGGYMEYAQGGIHIDPSKRGTFKAQATRMDMGVQEAADKILSAPEGTYSPEMRKKANFARNFAKKYGGMMEYQNGGSKFAFESDVRSGSRNFLSPTSAFTEQGTRIINRYPDSPNDTSYMYMNPSTSYFYNTGQNAPGGRPVQNFSGTESKPDNSYYQAKIKTLAGYRTGGMATSTGVPRQYANAELEGGEIVEKQMGPDVYVKGPSHEKGGVPIVLQEGGPAEGGDYVWSDHLTYKGKTMAEWYEMAVNNGASEQEIDQLRMLQEQLAGRAPGQGMEQTTKSGGLMKYQNGTTGLSPFIQNPNMTPGEIEAYNKLREQKRVAQNLVAQSQATTTKKKTAPKKFEYELMPPLRVDKDGNPIMARDSSAEAFVPNFKRMIELDKEATLPNPLPMAYTPAPTTSGLKPTKEKGKLSNLVKYAPELGLLAMGAIEAAMVPSEYDLPEVPATPQISVDKVFLDRSRAGELARARGAAEFRTSIDAARGSGMGPGAMSYMQREQNAIRNAVEEAAINAEKLNLAQSAEEKSLNLGAELDTKKFNAEMKRVYDALGIARGTSLADFKIQRRNAIAEAIKSGVVGAAKTYSSGRLGAAYAGNTGVDNRYTMDQLKELGLIKA